jgi:UDP-N-acetylmuramyl pentapeptide phosphotransferase/UDP-N-acetylglucosamine-1-phosphate transferase
MSAAGPIVGAAAFVVCVALTLAVIRLCHRWRLFDAPGPLKIHSQPIPRLGGIGIALAILTASCFAGLRPALHAWPLFSGMGLIWAAGLADDVRGLSLLYRLAAQAAAGVMLWCGGWRLRPLEQMTGGDSLGLLAVCLFVVALVNAFNFLDGADGLAAGVAGIIAAAYIAFPGAAANPFAGAVAWSLLGACAGFLFFNFPPAKIFLGDSGSTVLGFGVAFLGLDFYRWNPAIGARWLFPLVVAGLPLLDAALAVIRRLKSGASPFHGDRRHFYDLLLARGWSPRSVALVCYGITSALAVGGWFGVRAGPARFSAISALSLGGLVAAAIRLGALRGTTTQTPIPCDRSIRQKNEGTRV